MHEINKLIREMGQDIFKEMEKVKRGIKENIKEIIQI